MIRSRQKCLKNMGKEEITMLTEIFSTARKTKPVLKYWKMGVIVPLHKKGTHITVTTAGALYY